MCVCFCVEAAAQQISVEFDKKSNLSRINTFQFGESQITTPNDQKQVEDRVLHQWIVKAIAAILKYDKLTQADSLADVVVTYAFGILARTDYERLGPLAQTPGLQQTATHTFDYRQSTLVIDLTTQGGNLLYRINATNNLTSPLTERFIVAVIDRGFKKFDKLHKQKK
jgi:Domain of unknown function (DUF4136)